MLRTFETMYEKFDRDRTLLPPDRFCEVRYEDLVANPVGEMRTIYERLELGDFEQVLAPFEHVPETDGRLPDKPLSNAARIRQKRDAAVGPVHGSLRVPESLMTKNE